MKKAAKQQTISTVVRQPFQARQQEVAAKGWLATEDALLFADRMGEYLLSSSFLFTTALRQIAERNAALAQQEV